MEYANREKYKILVGIAGLSASMLALEITLTNIFSVIFQYHYISTIISIAIFGIGVGALVAYLSYLRALKRRTKDKNITKTLYKLGLLSLIIAIIIASLAVFFSTFPFVSYMTVFILISAIPFILFGWVIGEIFSVLRKETSLVYAYDLFGAAIGVFISFFLINQYGGINALFIIAFFTAINSLLFFIQKGSVKSGIASVLTFIIVCSILIILRDWDINFAFFKGAAPDKTIVSVLQNSKDAKIIHTEWDTFARTDVVETSDPNRKILFVNGGAGSYMYNFDGDLASVQALSKDVEFLPFIMGPMDETLIIGAGGGRDVLYTLLAGGDDITAIEISPGIVKSMEKFGKFNGDILNNPKVSTVISEGRNALEESEKKYNAIVLNLVYSQVLGVRNEALIENYVYTVEAFESYLRHLNPDGRIIIISHHGLEGTRAFYTGMQALMNITGEKASEIADNTALLMASESSVSPGITMSVIKNTPLSSEELEILNLGAQSLKLTPLFLPGTQEKLLEPLLSNQISFDDFVRDSDYNVYPTSDNHPFFFQMDKELPSSLWQWVLALVFLSIIVWVLLVLALEKGKHRNVLDGKRIPYYVLIGIGYMCIQIPLIQKSLLIIGNPVTTTAVILISMLIGGGLGSFISNRWKPSIVKVSMFITVIIVTYVLLSPYLSNVLLTSPLITRILVVGSIVFLLAIFLGLPFPLGLAHEEKMKSGSSPFYFAINGLASIWGSWFATTLSILNGFNLVLYLGCAFYIILGLLYMSRGRGLLTKRTTKTKIA